MAVMWSYQTFDTGMVSIYLEDGTIIDIRARLDGRLSRKITHEVRWDGTDPDMVNGEDYPPRRELPPDHGNPFIRPVP